MQGARLAKAVKGSTRLQGMFKLDKRARRQQTTGTVPAGVWGYQIKGIAPSPLQRLRSSIAKSVFPSSSGGVSTTAAIHLGFSPRQDPGVFVYAGIVVEYVEHITRDPELLSQARRVWTSILGRVVGANMWAKVTGPLSAAIAALRFAGWGPAFADRWADPSGDW